MLVVRAGVSTAAAVVVVVFLDWLLRDESGGAVIQVLLPPAWGGGTECPVDGKVNDGESMNLSSSKEAKISAAKAETGWDKPLLLVCCCE